MNSPIPSTPCLLPTQKNANYLWGALLASQAEAMCQYWVTKPDYCEAVVPLLVPHSIPCCCPVSCLQSSHPPKVRAKRRVWDGPIKSVGEGVGLNVEVMTIMAHSLEEIRSGQAEVTFVQAGSEWFATLLCQIHNAQYFLCSNRKKIPVISRISCLAVSQMGLEKRHWNNLPNAIALPEILRTSHLNLLLPLR